VNSRSVKSASKDPYIPASKQTCCFEEYMHAQNKPYILYIHTQASITILLIYLGLVIYSKPMHLSLKLVLFCLRHELYLK